MKVDMAINNYMENDVLIILLGSWRDIGGQVAFARQDESVRGANKSM